MRILMLSWNFPPTIGGIENVVDNLWRTFRAQGHEVRVVTRKEPASEGEEPGVVRARRPGLKGYLAHSLLGGAGACRRFRPEVILCGSLVSLPAALALSLVFRRPFFVIVYGADLLRLTGARRGLFRWLLNRARAVVAISRATRELALQTGVRPDRIRIIHPGVEAQRFAAEPGSGAEALLERLRGRRVLIQVGRLVRRKGVLWFVENVMPELARRHPDLVYLVVGEDARASLIHAEQMRATIERRVAELGLGEHVWLPGELPEADLNRLFFRADLLVMPVLETPDDFEGFGIVMLEGVLAGAPAVASRTGGITDAVEDGVSGVLVTPGAASEFIEAIDGLLGDDPRRGDLARRGAARARDSFDWPVIARRYVDLFNDTSKAKAAS